MIFLEWARQGSLLNLLKGKETEKACGGSAANTIIAAGHLGSETFYSCRVANDGLGDFYKTDLESESVEHSLKTREAGTTGTCLVMTTPDADRTMNTFLGATSQFNEENVDWDALKESKWLYIEGYLVAAPDAFQACLKAQRFAKENNIKVALTFSDPGIVNAFKSQMEELVSNGLDLVFANEDEARAFTSEETVDEACFKLKEQVKAFAITLGRKGCLVYDGDDHFIQEGRIVEAIDTNGAGDMFAGSFLHQLIKTNDYRSAAQWGVRFSSQIVQKYGPRLDKKVMEEIKRDL